MVEVGGEVEYSGGVRGLTVMVGVEETDDDAVDDAADEEAAVMLGLSIAARGVGAGLVFTGLVGWRGGGWPRGPGNIWKWGGCCQFTIGGGTPIGPGPRGGMSPENGGGGDHALSAEE